ncbi:MAG: hypothetical protein M1815_001148, partial [Lichina confinis]
MRQFDQAGAYGEPFLEAMPGPFDQGSPSFRHGTAEEVVGKAWYEGTASREGQRTAVSCYGLETSIANLADWLVVGQCTKDRTQRPETLLHLPSLGESTHVHDVVSGRGSVGEKAKPLPSTEIVINGQLPANVASLVRWISSWV